MSVHLDEGPGQVQHESLLKQAAQIHLLSVLFPPFFFLLTQGPQYLQCSSVKPLSWVALGVIRGHAGVSHPTHLLQSSKELIFELASLIIVQL